MKKSNTIIVLTVLALIAVLGFGYQAFAHGGYGHHGYGYNGHHGYMGNLSEDEITKLDDERKAFYKATQDLRQKIYEKELEMENLFADRDPDPKRTASLQKELSELHSQFDQERIEHMTRIRKFSPDAGRGCWY